MSTELECRGFWGEEKVIEKRREGQKGAFRRKVAGVEVAERGWL